MRILKKAYLEITNVCNLSCVFCPGTRREKGFLTPEQFRVLAGRLRPHTEYLYLHLMGEPLLHPQLAQLLKITEDLDFSVMITTNGTLLPQQGSLLCASPAVKRVSISLHSFEGNEKLYSQPGDGGWAKDFAVRQDNFSPESFVDSKENWCRMAAKDELRRRSTVVNTASENSGPLSGYLDGCLQFAAEASAAGKRCVLRLWNLDGADTRGANGQNETILNRLAERFPRPWKEGRQGTALADRIYLEWGERFDWPDLSAAEGDGSGFCYGLRDQVGVLWDGTVVPCCLDHEGDLPLGNLYRQTLGEILDAPRARAVYDGFSQRRAVEELCRKCGYARRFHTR